MALGHRRRASFCAMHRPSDGLPAAGTAKGFAFRFIAVSLGFTIGLGLAEGLLHIIGPDGHMQTKRALQRDPPGLLYHCYDSNPHGEMESMPDVTTGKWSLHDYNIPPTEIDLSRLPETPHCIEYRFNEIELRDKEVSLSPPRGKVRVAMLGDSFVFGEGVPAHLMLSRQLQALLGDSYEVLNTGLPGLNNEEETERLSEVVKTLAPQWVIIVWLINDLSMSGTLQDEQSFIHDLVNVRAKGLDGEFERAWWTKSKLFRMIGSWFALRSIRLQTIEWYRKTFAPEHNEAGLDLFARNLRRMSTCAGKRCAFVLYPLIQDLESGYPFSDIHERVAGQAAALGMPVLDLLPTFEGRDTEQLWVHSSDHHPNGKAHALAAKRIARWLQEEVPGFSTPKP